MLKNLFVSDVRVKILKLFLLNPDKQYHVRAVVRAVNAEINAVRRELENLHEIKLLTRRQSSNRIYYKVDPEHIFFSDLISLFSKEEGLGSMILKEMKNLGDIEYAVLSKAFLRGRQSSVLDVDLFIVGEPRLDVLEKIIKDFESKSGREVNFSVMDSEQFKYRKRTNDQFVIRVLAQGRTMLTGDEENFSSIISNL